MVRDTSIAAYNAIKNNGMLSRRRWQVYNWLYQYGPCTHNELFRHVVRGDKKLSNANISARLNELRERGVASEVGQRPCSISGHTVIVWDVTSKLPVEPLKRKTNKEIIKEQREHIAYQEIVIERMAHLLRMLNAYDPDIIYRGGLGKPQNSPQTIHKLQTMPAKSH